MTKPKSLFEQVTEREIKESNQNAFIKKNEKKTIDFFTDSNSKDKQISAKVNSNLYDIFTKINRMQGLSNNSALNMLIAKYVHDNKDFIDN